MRDDVFGRRRKSPRYQEILEAIRRRIYSGDYPVGTNLPSEAEFCVEFGSSRFTVREALRRLQSDGLVSRQQGAGSKVVRTTTSGAFVQSYGSLAELLQFARDTDFQRLSVGQATLDATMAARVGGTPGEDWTVLRGLRLEGPGAAPFALIESYIPPRFAGLVPDLGVGRPPFYRVLEEASGDVVTDVVQETQALQMPALVAEALGVPTGTLSLRLLRRYESASGTLIASFNWHFGGARFIHRTHLRLQDASG